MSNNHKTVLVTGADGFIGSHMVEHLIQKGFKVRAFCMYNSFSSYGWLDTVSEDIKEQIDFLLGDIRDSEFVNEAMEGVGIVYHLAALISIPYSYKAAGSYIDTNIKGTLNVLDAAKRHNVKRVVVTSSSEVYGTAQYIPMDEKHPKNGQSPYAASKIGADALALSFHKSFDLPVTVVRPFNTFGPRQSVRAIISTIITQVLKGFKSISLGNLKPTRDFLFVEDTVSAFEEITRCDGLIGKEVNIATGKEISMKSLAEEILAVMKVDIPIVEKEQRFRPENSEVYRLVGDGTLLLEMTKWKPESTFSVALKKTVEWFSKEENLLHYKSNGYQI